jgi:uncharacterized phage protein gp47/JayE
MSLTYPTFEELAGQSRAELRKQLPEIDPTVFGSWARSFLDGNAVLAQDIQFNVRDLEKQLFPQDSEDEFLDRWGGYEDLTRNPETGSTGFISLDDTTVTVTTVIPALTQFTGSNGLIYSSTAVATIVATSQVIASIERSGSTATATMTADHQLATGMQLTVSGATPSEYNVADVTITVTERNKFTYPVAGTPTTPAGGSPVYALNMASISVQSTTTGATTNLDSGAQLSNATYGTALTQIDGLSGGAAKESNEAYRSRIMLSRSLISGVFTPDQIKLAALSITGNTRAFVKKPTITGAGGSIDPYPGQTSVFVLRDNDANIIPSQTVLDTTKTKIIEDGKLPANTAESDLFVNGPTLVETDFDFTALNPDTPTMRTAVENNLLAFFEDTVEFETDVTEASYLGAIQNTQDLETGAFIVSFELSAPSGDITVSDGEIASLGVVSFTI